MNLDEQQLNVIKAINDNKNILLLGQAGTGKSKIITELKNYIKNKPVYITSTTGISALNIGGVTLHSFLGIGLGEGAKEELYIKVYKNFKIRKRLQQKSILLIIDEVSMLSIILFEKINYIFQEIRNNKKPFGGVQILLSGDFLQLEPINDQPVYKSELLKSYFDIIFLTKNYRQNSDAKFQTILTNLRCNKLTEDDLFILNNLVSNNNINNDDNSIRLFTTNALVNQYNNKYIILNSNKEYIFTAEFKGDDKYYLSDIQKQFKTKNIDKLILKEKIKVMLTKNLDISLGLVNGTLGIIEEFVTGLPKVKFNNGISMIINKSSWEIIFNGKTIASAIQLPLVIAYASTIHKCQGTTLNSAIIDLQNVFAPHMIYVALSRVKSLEGLTLLNFNPKKIQINNDTVEFYNLNEKNFKKF